MIFMEVEMELRPEVLRFAAKMESVLRKNDWKGGWQRMTTKDSLSRLYEELRELNAAAKTGPPELIVKEAVDVANFAMFIAENLGGEIDG